MMKIAIGAALGYAIGSYFAVGIVSGVGYAAVNTTPTTFTSSLTTPSMRNLGGAAAGALLAVVASRFI